MHISSATIVCAISKIPESKYFNRDTFNGFDSSTESNNYRKRNSNVYHFGEFGTAFMDAFNKPLACFTIDGVIVSAHILFVCCLLLLVVGCCCCVMITL
jgi:hypothetical protein